MSETPDGTPQVEGQGQQAPVPAAPAAPVSTGPWAADLAALTQDPATLAKFDQYMREKVQPRQTKLEQDLAANKDAINLWQQLNEAPVDTFIAMTNELFGEEQAKKMLAELEASQQQQAPQASAEPQGQQDPRLEHAIQYIEQQQANALYDAEIKRISEARPDIKPHLLHQFIAGAEGNFDRAVELYDSTIAELTPAQQQEIADTPPPAMGSDTQTGQASSTPTQPKKETINQAIDSWIAEQRATPAPPVIG